MNPARPSRSAIARLAAALERRTSGEVRAVRVAVLLLASMQIETEARGMKHARDRATMRRAATSVYRLLDAAELLAVLGRDPNRPAPVVQERRS